jgi:hypothetical protein
MRHQMRYGIAALFEQRSPGPMQMLHEHRQRFVCCVDGRIYKHLHSIVLYHPQDISAKSTGAPQLCQNELWGWLILSDVLNYGVADTLHAYNHAERNLLSGYNPDVIQHACKYASNCTCHRRSHIFCAGPKYFLRI